MYVIYIFELSFMIIVMCVFLVDLRFYKGYDMWNEFAIVTNVYKPRCKYEADIGL